jgi:pimeloyl-ACP methyl ester carboxylesterase
MLQAMLFVLAASIGDECQAVNECAWLLYSTTKEQQEMAIAGTTPTIVFLHGSGGTAQRWQRQVDFLGNGRALALDLPGHGSRVREVGPPEMSMHDYALDVHQQMQAAGVAILHRSGHELPS